MATVQVRLQKVLARAGVASRRAAEELITAGRVRVDGHIVTELGTKVDAKGTRVEVDGTRIVREAAVYVVLHKPRGVVSTMSDPEGRPSVRELLTDLHMRIFPVGRLDFNTSGVLLATNDGDFMDTLLHPRKAVPKSYVVKVNGVMEPHDVEVWRRGVELEDGKTQPAKVKLLRHESDKTWLELTITEGRNQQIRRMGEATGFRVMRLARTSFAGITSEDLAPGRWRHLTPDEQKTLKNDYGVPKRVVSPPQPNTDDRRDRSPGPRSATPHAKGRPRRQEGGEAGGGTRPPHGGGRSGGAGRGPRADATSGRHESATRPERGAGVWRGQEREQDWGHPRGKPTRSGPTGRKEAGSRAPSVGRRNQRNEAQGPAPGGAGASAKTGKRDTRGTGRREGKEPAAVPVAARPARRDRGSEAKGPPRKGPGTANRSGRPSGPGPRTSPEPKSGGARYGGGSPGRRDPDVGEDWGGGIRRGSSGDRDPAPPPRPDTGGRAGRSRTTGTGGGVGASEGDYRVRSRRN